MQSCESMKAFYFHNGITKKEQKATFYASSPVSGYFRITFQYFAAAYWFSGTAAELHIDQAVYQMAPEGHDLTDVRCPGRVETEAA